MAYPPPPPVEAFPTANYEHRDSPSEHHTFLLVVVLTVFASWGAALYLASLA